MYCIMSAEMAGNISEKNSAVQNILNDIEESIIEQAQYGYRYTIYTFPKNRELDSIITTVKDVLEEKGYIIIGNKNMDSSIYFHIYW